MYKYLKHIILGLALTGVLAFVPVAAQEQPPPEAVVVQPAPMVAKLEVKDIVELLSVYDVIHQSEISGGQLWGLTQWQESKIYLSDKPDLAIRKLTVIHELLHAIYFQKAINTNSPDGEAWVDAEAKRIYKELYGITGH
jgi:hypothetical protein